MGDYRASVKDIDKTLELEPRHFGALSGLGLIMTAMGNEEAAISAFEATLAVHPFAEGARQNLEALQARQKEAQPVGPYPLNRGTTLSASMLMASS